MQRTMNFLLPDDRLAVAADGEVLLRALDAVCVGAAHAASLRAE
jgi:hypothetical protein